MNARPVKPNDVQAETIEAVHDDVGRDSVPEFGKDVGQAITVTPEENKRILRKIDLAILPIILIIYCLQSLDKSSLSYAAVFKLQEHTNLVGKEFSWLGSIVYVAQLVWQPAVAYFLVKFPIGKFCGVMVSGLRKGWKQSADEHVGPLLGGYSLWHGRCHELRRFDGDSVPPWFL